MSSTTMQVRLEVVSYGVWNSLEVAIDVNSADGKTLYLTTPTVETILNYRPNSLRQKLASKSLKSFLGKGYNIGKFSGSIVNKQQVGTSKVSLISLKDFMRIAIWESVANQNFEIAQILAAGFEDSFRSLAYEQLGVELDLEERQAKLTARLAGIVKRNGYTDAIVHYIKNNKVSVNYVKFVYPNCSDAINKAILGKTAKQLCVERNCDKHNLRDSHSADILDRIATIEKYAEKLILKLNTEPLEATKESIAFFED